MTERYSGADVGIAVRDALMEPVRKVTLIVQIDFQNHASDVHKFVLGPTSYSLQALPGTLSRRS